MADELPEYVVASVDRQVRLLRRAKPGIHDLDYRAVATFGDDFDAGRAARVLNAAALKAGEEAP